MKAYIVASTRENAGKTSLIIGMASAAGKKCGYLKPFGDRLVYQRKISWDHDAALVTRLWGLDLNPDEMTLGFSHPKLRFVHDERSLSGTLPEMAAKASRGSELLFIEGGKDISYGASISLDPLTVARYTGAGVILVASGEADEVLDDIAFFRSYCSVPGITISGVIINKVRDIDDFTNTSLKTITSSGMNVLGVVPYEDSLTHYSVRYLAENLFAKVIGGEGGLGNIVKNFFVGAMSAEESLRNPVFARNDNVAITSGDRSDMILASLKKGTSAIVLTNNIMPPPNIIAGAAQKNIPLLLVAQDTYHVTKQVYMLQALTTPDDAEKIEKLAQLARNNISLGGL